MKRYLIFPAAVLVLALAACGRSAVEVTPSAPAMPTPKPTVIATATAAPEATAPVIPTPTPTTAPPAESTPEVVPTPTPAPAATPKPQPLPTPTPALVTTPEPDPTPVLPPEVVLTPEPTEGVERPGEDEVLEAYWKAYEAYGWFDRTTLACANEGGRELEGQVYYPVLDERFPTMDSLRAYLKGIFSDEVVDRLLPAEPGAHYVDIDGALYVLPMDRSTPEDRGIGTLEAIWPMEGEPVLCTVRVRVERYDLAQGYPLVVVGEELHDFTYQKVGDKWVFTNFETLF